MTKSTYYQLAQAGMFAGQRVELLDGDVFAIPQQTHAHVKAISRIDTFLRVAFGPAHWVRVHGPLDISDRSQPEPDIAVAELSLEEYSDHPTSALLVVEVSDGTVKHDRRKGAYYASSGAAQYWILNLEERQLEVYREPRADRESETGWSYAQRRALSETDEV